MQDHRAIVDRIRGPLVPLMPAFTDDEKLDLDSTSGLVDWLIEAGIPLFWTTYGTSHFMSLGDAEIMDLTRAIAGVTRGRALYIASTAWQWPVAQCREFIRRAADWGVDAVKLQVFWSFAPSDQAVFDYYQAIAADSPLPLFAYSLAVPGVTAGMTTDLLKRILGELPQFVGMKNDSGDFYEHHAYLQTIRAEGARFAALTGGSMMSFFYGYPFGAQAFACGVGMLAPQAPLDFYACLLQGRADRAAELIKRWEEPYSTVFPPLGHWAAFHTALWLLGRFRSRCVRFPLRTLGQEAVAKVGNQLTSWGLL